jgi:hypothetical protein
LTYWRRKGFELARFCRRLEVVVPYCYIAIEDLVVRFG